MRDPLGRGQLFELHDPFAMHRGIEQRGKPEQSRKMRLVAHHFGDRRMRDLGDLGRPDAVDIVIEPLEREAVQIHEVAGNVQADPVASVLAFQRAEHEALDQHGGTVAQIAARNEPLPVFECPDVPGERFEIGLFGLAHILAQSPGQKMSGLGISLQFASGFHRTSCRKNPTSSHQFRSCVRRMLALLRKRRFDRSDTHAYPHR